MQEHIQQPKRVFRLDLGKYGLSHLDGRNILDLSEEDLLKFFSALSQDDISLQLPVQFAPQNIREMLARAECRRCGGCCIPNPLNPGSPGVEVFEDELRIMAPYLDTDYETMLAMTAEGKNQDAMYPLNLLISTRLLPLPCPFYMEETRSCRAYKGRPLVCAIYPVVFGEIDEYIEIKVNCDYGRDVARGALKALKERNPNFVLKI